MEILKMSALEISRRIKNKEITVKEVLDIFYYEIEKKNPIYNCFVLLSREYAYKRAEEIQKRIDKGEDISPLAGVPIGIKDNIVTKNIKTTCASKMLENFVPVYNADVIDRIEKAGLIIVGKLNMDEFAMGSTTKNSIFGSTKNPYDISKTAGGSSGASAAAISLHLVPLALGSDTGGSVREPASFCGVLGLKPTYGKVSRYGLIAFASSLDTIGVLSNYACDCAQLLNIIACKDERDSTSLESPKIDMRKSKDFSFENKRIAVIKELLTDEISDEVKEAVLNAAQILKNEGAEICEISMQNLKYIVPTYYIIACAEASSNLSRYDGIRYGYCDMNSDSLEELYTKSRSGGFSLEVKKRIMLGNFVLSADNFESYYKKALKAKNLIAHEYFSILESFDYILSPVYPVTAPTLNEDADDSLKVYMGDICTAGANLSAIPAISIPFAMDKNNMPIGIELTGNKFAEEDLLLAANEFMMITGMEK